MSAFSDECFHFFFLIVNIEKQSGENGAYFDPRVTESFIRWHRLLKLTRLLIMENTNNYSTDTNVHTSMHPISILFKCHRLVYLVVLIYSKANFYAIRRAAWFFSRFFVSFFYVIHSCLFNSNKLFNLLK